MTREGQNMKQNRIGDVTTDGGCKTRASKEFVEFNFWHRSKRNAPLMKEMKEFADISQEEKEIWSIASTRFVTQPE